MGEEELVFVGDTLFLQSVRRLANALAGLTQRPIAPAVEGASGSVVLAPMKIGTDKLLVST